MLAQNFKSADELGIGQEEWSALLHVLGMLERAELQYVGEDIYCDNGFNMGTQGYGCGTPACIGGWVARMLGKEEREYVNSFMPDYPSSEKPLTNLYWHFRGEPSVEQSATALRNFLVTGNAKWREAVAA